MVVAVILTVPGDTAVTTPSTLTVAIAGLSDVQVTVLSVVLAGYTVAVTCELSPISSVKLLGVTMTDDASTLLTVTAHVALRLLPSAVVAVILTTPGDTAVTTPSTLTVAIAGLSDVQVTVLSVVLAGNTVAVI